MVALFYKDRDRSATHVVSRWPLNGGTAVSVDVSQCANCGGYSGT